jgi:hypothetical protein
VVVTNRHNNKKVTVRINDRGPFVSARIIDVSRAAAEQLDMIITGTAPVLVESDQIIVSSSALTPPPAPPPVVTAPVVTPPPVVVAPPPVTTPPPVPPVYTPPVYTPPAEQEVYIPPQQIVPQPPPPPPIPIVPRYETARLSPEINIVANKTYRLQIGSYQVARNAVEAFERLKNAGLSPNYERHTDSVKGDFFRVVIAGVPGSEVQSTAEKIGAAGFRDALIREE